MIGRSLLFALSVLVFASVWAGPVVATTNTDKENVGDARDRTGGAGPSDILTRQVIDQIQRDFRYCTGIDRNFRFDCYKYVFRLAADALDGNRAYRTAHEVFDTLDRQIDALVDDAIDSSRLPKLRGLQIYRPVLAEEEPRLRAETARLLEEAETTLLRAPEQSGDHYTRIAAAVNSNKVLLRSALIWLRHVILRA